MKYVNEEHLHAIGMHWDDVFSSLKNTIDLLYANDFAQPIKPYLRYKNPVNRIIAMPAYIGGDFQKAGIKWIASFPENKKRGLPRAHSVTILNHADTGEPFFIVNSNLISIIRTAGVSGVIVDEFIKRRKILPASLTAGLVGMGPIGITHVEMLVAQWSHLIKTIRVYDLHPPDITRFSEAARQYIEIVPTWKHAYRDADIFITCTVAKERYINEQPKTGSLHLNVSLRDYLAGPMRFMDIMIVDDWEEVCRENTDIEFMYKEKGLTKDDTISFTRNKFSEIVRSITAQNTIMFNPMGMAVFDIAVAWLYYNKALEFNQYISL